MFTPDPKTPSSSPNGFCKIFSFSGLLGLFKPRPKVNVGRYIIVDKKAADQEIESLDFQECIGVLVEKENGDYGFMHYTSHSEIGYNSADVLLNMISDLKIKNNDQTKVTIYRCETAGSDFYSVIDNVKNAQDINSREVRNVLGKIGCNNIKEKSGAPNIIVKQGAVIKRCLSSSRW